MPVDIKRIHSLSARVSRLLGAVAASASPSSVHHLRSSVRRMEAVRSALLEEPQWDRKLDKQLKRLRKRAGRVRDIDVQLKAIKTIDIGGKGKDKNRTKRFLERTRQQRSKELKKMLDTDKLAGLRARLRTSMETLSGKKSPGQAPHVPLLTKHPIVLAYRMFSELVKEMPELNQENLHQFRTQCKKIRYTAEIETDNSETQQFIASLARAQEAIGEWHDWILLLETADEVLSSHTNSPLLSAIRNFTVSRFSTAMRIAKETRSKISAMVRTHSESAPEPVAPRKRQPQPESRGTSVIKQANS